jgi:hypothetical protein
MTPRLRLLPLLIWALLAPMAAALANAASPAAPPAGAPVISVLTFSPGEIYWQRFGHNALLVREQGRAVVYNYGIFDFQQEDFLLNFARGRMQYLLAQEPFAQTLALYRHEGRAVVEQQLDLTPEQAIALRDFLVINALPENAEYRYDYFLSNCSTKLRDAIDLALDGQLRAQLEALPAAQNFRQQVVRLTAPDLPLMLGLDMVLGPAADRPRSLWEESFVPMVLQAALRDAVRINEQGERVPLVRVERQLVTPRLAGPADSPPRLWPAFLLIGLALGGALFALATRRHRAARTGFMVLSGVLMLLATVAGMVMLGFWSLTEHWAGWRNASLLLFNPLAVALLPGCLAVLRGQAPSRTMRWLSLIIAGLAVLALALTGVQANLHWLLFWLPIYAAVAAVFHIRVAPRA